MKTVEMNWIGVFVVMEAMIQSMTKELPRVAFLDYCKKCKTHHTTSICPKPLSEMVAE